MPGATWGVLICTASKLRCWAKAPKLSAANVSETSIFFMLPPFRRPRPCRAAALPRDLPDVPARGGQHELELLHQLVGAQAFLHLDLQVEELDDVAERLREHELAAARDDRDAARAELAQLFHSGRIAVHVDRLVIHAALGEELLGSQAAGASGLPENFDPFGCKHVGTLRSDRRDRPALPAVNKSIT